MRIDNIQARRYNVAEYLFGDDATDKLDLIDDYLPIFFCDKSDRDVLVAFRWYLEGKKLSFSSGICESLTAGYGEIDGLGYWEFPLPLGFVDRFYGVN